jgi:DNA-binding transcriptional regulator YiaG
MMVRKKSLSKETIDFIRQQVLNGTSKAQLARNLGVSYRTVWNHTKDIRTQRILSRDLIEAIRQDVQHGATKFQTAQKYDVSRSTVYYWTKDIPGRNCGWPGIRGKTLEMLKELVANGFLLPTGENVHGQFLTLRKYFPSIYRISMYGTQIFLLKGKEEEAVRAFLGSTRKKIISYQELHQVTEVFGADISRKEKEAFLFKKQGRHRSDKKGVQKGFSLREDEDSFSFFYIRRYCPSVS